MVEVPGRILCLGDFPSRHFSVAPPDRTTHISLENKLILFLLLQMTRPNHTQNTRRNGNEIDDPDLPNIPEKLPIPNIRNPSWANRPPHHRHRPVPKTTASPLGRPQPRRPLIRRWI